MTRRIRPHGVSRREFFRFTGAGLGGLALSSLSLPGCRDDAEEDRFTFAVLADTHIIDPYYTGPEGSPEDTESMFHTRERLEAARDVINHLTPRVEQVFIAGDVVHNYPSEEWEFYFQNETRWDISKALLDGFHAPVHIGLGNHDYDVPTISRQFTHDLFREKFGIEPYYAVEHKGWKFVHLNNFLGATWDSTSDQFNKDVGSLGETQLNWLEQELQQGAPTFIFLHFPLASVDAREVGDLDIFSLLTRYQETIALVISGHWHVWLDMERGYGPHHLLAASTRYDQDSFLIIEADRKNNTHRIVNWDRLEWYSHFAEPMA